MPDNNLLLDSALFFLLQVYQLNTERGGKMAIKILVVHEYTVIQKIVNNYILTEYSDAVVKSFSSTLDAIEEVKKVKYDIIFCAMEMPKMDGIAFSEAILETFNKNAHFVIMTSNYDEKNIKAYRQLGINNILSIPFTQPQLTMLIQNIVNPRSKRVDERYFIQNTQVLIPLENQELKAKLINIGMNGLLCELKLKKEYANILLSNKLRLKLPDSFGNVIADNIVSCLMRLSVTEWDSNHTPKTLRIAYRFVDMPIEARQIVRKAIKSSAKELTLAETEALEKIMQQEHKQLKEAVAA
jgi:CheY-like chemotaxis protein